MYYQIKYLYYKLYFLLNQLKEKMERWSCCSKEGFEKYCEDRQNNYNHNFLGKIQNLISEKIRKKILLLYDKISRWWVSLPLFKSKYQGSVFSFKFFKILPSFDKGVFSKPFGKHICSCTIFLFIELETSNFGYLFIL